ncbi:MFS transporter [Paenibacillus spiritus]|uniref:MFS transporter n=1 Tax=Paenibacillus spiritus TaxID=2496557 RepID=A0A5J5GD20_9BACL|nr:MFS transporter [Paenibacillus spiritus]KAA9005344.1 MFS transporter [Paenibacillus spiritus]
MCVNKEPLGKQAWLLLAVDGLFVLSGALSGTFLNIYLWRSRSDYAMIGWFTAAQQAALGISFWIGGRWVKGRGKMNALRVGIALSGLFYLLVLRLGPRSVDYIWPLGALLGAALGLFWLSFNVVYFEITGPGNRDRFNGWTGLLGSLTGIVGPWTSGALISAMKGERGYRVVFLASLSIYGAAAVLSLALRRRKTAGSYRWLEPVRRLRVSGQWRCMAGALFFQGLREGVFSFLVGLLVYLATREENRLGQFTLMTSAIALVSYGAAGRWLTPRRRLPGMLAGAVLLTAVTLPLLAGTRYSTLLLFGAGTALFLPLYMLPMVSSSFDLMGDSEDSVGKRVELIVLRELSLMAGRLTGTLLFVSLLPLGPKLRLFTLLLLGLGAAPFGSWFLLRRSAPALSAAGKPKPRSLRGYLRNGRER